MREFEYTFADGFIVGLRKHHKNPRNSEALVEAYNVRCGPAGLEPYVAPTSVFTPITTAMGDDWLDAYVQEGYVEDGYVTP